MALVAGLGASLLLSGCQVTNPAQTDVAYQPADGVAVDMGPVQIRGLVVVSDAEGGPGTIVGNLSNDSGTAAQVSMAPEGQQSPITVDAAAYGSESLSTQDQVIIPAVSVAPGGVLSMQIGTPESGLNVVLVPVLPARDYYEGFKPTASPTVTSSPTGTP